MAKRTAKDASEPEMKIGQSFFKCILTSSKKLGIPPLFVSQMQGALGKEVILRDRCGNLWPVEVDRNGDNWSFNKGWPRFYEEHSLTFGDFLVFEYKNDNLFDCTLFGANACEKRGMGAPKFKVKEEENFSIDDDDADYMQEEDEQGNITRMDNSDSKSKSSPAVRRENKTIGIRTIPSRQEYKKNNVPNCYGPDIFKQGLATRPKDRPFFVSRSRLSRKNELCIPKQVIVDYKLDIPAKIFLVDEHDTRLEATVKKWKDGRMWITGGWKSLCNVNNIGVDDVCICEFFKEGDEDMCVLVRVVDGAGGRSASAPV